MKNLLKSLENNQKMINEKTEDSKKSLFLLMNKIIIILNSKRLFLDTVFDSQGHPDYELWYSENQLLKKEPSNHKDYDDQETYGQYYYKDNRLEYLLNRIKDNVKTKIDRQEKVIKNQKKLSDIINIIKGE